MRAMLTHSELCRTLGARVAQFLGMRDPLSSMRQLFALLLIPAAVLAGCRRGVNEHNPKEVTIPAPPQPAPETFALGTRVEASGAVAADAASESIARGTTMFLSVDLTGATAPERIQVTWTDAHGAVRARQTHVARRDMPYATFSSGSTSSWPFGRSSASVVIDDRRVAHRVFIVHDGD